MNFRFVELQQGTPAWRAWRQEGVGASDAASIMGVSPYATLAQVFAEKMVHQERPQTFAMRRGNRLEPVAREMFTRQTGIPVRPVCVENLQYPWLRASLDGWRSKGAVILEIKAPNIGDHGYACEGLVPVHYRPQLVHQCLATGADEVFYASYSEHSAVPAEKRLCIVRYVPTAEELGTLLDLEEKFWAEVEAFRLREIGSDAVPHGDDLFNEPNIAVMR